MIITSKPSGVTDVSWITFNPITTDVEWMQTFSGFEGNYTI